MKNKNIIKNAMHQLQQSHIPISFLRRDLQKHISLHGNVGKWVGRKIGGGTLHLHGNVGTYVGLEVLGGELSSFFCRRKRNNKRK